MNEWKTYKLGKICDLVAGFAFKSKDFGLYPNKVVKIADIQPPIVSTTDLSGVNISSYDTSKLQKYVVKNGDYVLAMTGATIGKLGRIVNNIEAYVNQRVLTFRPNISIVDKDFLYYQLSSICFNKYILNHIDSETAQPNISAGSIGQYEIQLPPLDKQKAIANILKSLDEKIKTNCRINDNLEQQAQALYKQWFVDNRSEDWEEVKLSQIVDINKDSINPSLYPNTIFEHYSLPAYDAGILPVCEKGSDIKSSKFIINDNVILFSKLNPRIKRIWLPNPQTEHAICSTEFVPYQPKKSEMLGFCYSLLNSDDFYDFVLSLTNGSTGSHQRFHPKDTLDYNFRVPKIETISEFEDKVIPLYRIISKNRIENQKLAALRDTLLPKLMSGELSVDDVLVD